MSEQALKRRVRELATVIDHRHDTEELVIVAIMKGARVFAEDLSRFLNGRVEIAEIDASSYGGGTEAKPVTVGDASRLNLKGRDVLIVDDIIETGKTLAAV